MCRAGAPPPPGSEICPQVPYQVTGGFARMGVVHPDILASKCTIAIVEDDASFRRALERLLCASGFEAHTFASAEDFLGSAVPESHACLILDIRLPGMSGFELFDHLTASAQPRPVIFITAQDEDSARQQASRIPNSVYLRKPVVGAVLLEAVRSLLSRNSSGAESPGT
jgi:FixJ family two-component response regulator